MLQIQNDKTVIFANKSIIYQQIRLCQLLLKIWQNEKSQNNTLILAFYFLVPSYDRKIRLDLYRNHDYALFMFIKNFSCVFELFKVKIVPSFGTPCIFSSYNIGTSRAGERERVCAIERERKREKEIEKEKEGERELDNKYQSRERERGREREIDR